MRDFIYFHSVISSYSNGAAWINLPANSIIFSARRCVTDGKPFKNSFSELSSKQTNNEEFYLAFPSYYNYNFSFYCFGIKIVKHFL